MTWDFEEIVFGCIALAMFLPVWVLWWVALP